MYLASDAYNNTAIGSRAGDQLHGGSNNILIGAGVQAPNDHASDQLAIGNFIYGTNGDTQANAKVGIGTNAPDTKLHISTGGTDTAPIAGFKLEDGTQGEGKVLTSDTNGVGTWRDATPPNPWVHIYTMTFPLEPVIKENEYYRFEKTDNWSHTDFPDGTYELALIADANGFYNLTVNLMANGEWVISYRPDGTKATMWSTVINKSTSVMQLHYKGSNMYAPYKHILEYLSGPTATPTESMSPPALKTTELGSYEAGTRFDIYIRRIH